MLWYPGEGHSLSGVETDGDMVVNSARFLQQQLFA